MTLFQKLLAGISSVALLAMSGVGLQHSSADDTPIARTQVAQNKPLASLSLDELATLVTANINAGSASAEDAAQEFGAFLAEMLPSGLADDATQVAAANAFQLMMEELREIYGAFDESAIIVTAQASFLDGIQVAAGPTVQGDELGIGPDLEPAAGDTAVY